MRVQGGPRPTNVDWYKAEEVRQPCAPRIKSALIKTCLYRRVKAPITKTRPNNTRQRAKSKKSATPINAAL